MFWAFETLIRARQAEAHEQSAKILALPDCHITAVDLRHVAHDRETQTVPGLPVSRRAPRSKMRVRSPSGIPRPSSSTQITHCGVPGSASTVTNTLPPPYLAAFSIRVPKYFVEILPFYSHDRLTVTGDVDARFRIQALDCAPHRFGAFTHAGACMARRAATDRPCPRKMMLDVALHGACLTDHGVGKIWRAARLRHW